jgi:molecular chaperone GrpE
MTDSIPQEDELVGEEGSEEGGDPAGEAEDGPEGAAEDGLQAELEGLRDKHLRLVAEFNNFRRRTEQERLGAWARAQADLVAKFLDVLDDLNRVAQLDLSNATVDAIMEGIDLVERKFVRVLEDSGVEVINPQGQAFDPESMEAVMRVTADSEEQDEQVAQVFQKGYSLKGVLVRPARVSVYKDG